MAIGRTNTGGGIKLFVVGGTTQPSSVAENTIWLNTSTSIPKWSVTNTAPGSPAAGEVYITTRSLTSNVINISSPNPVNVYLGSAWQYVSGAWKQTAAQVYYSGSWHSLQTFVYDGSKNAGAGNYNSAIGGKPWTYGVDGGSASFWDSSDHFTFSSGGSSGAQWASTAMQIDFTDVKSVKFTYTGEVTTSKFIVFTNKNASGTRDYPNAQSSELTTTSQKTTVSINTAGLTGNFWLGISNASWGATATINVFSIELVT